VNLEALKKGWAPATHFANRPPSIGGLCCGSGLRRKLKHYRFLIFKHISKQYGHPVWKFQSIMMCSRVVLVDLPEYGRRMSDGDRLPGK